MDKAPRSGPRGKYWQDCVPAVAVDIKWWRRRFDLTVRHRAGVLRGAVPHGDEQLGECCNGRPLNSLIRLGFYLSGRPFNQMVEGSIPSPLTKKISLCGNLSESSILGCFAEVSGLDTRVSMCCVSDVRNLSRIVIIVHVIQAARIYEFSCLRRRERSARSVQLPRAAGRS